MSRHDWQETSPAPRGHSLVGAMPDPSKPDAEYVCRQCGCRVKGMSGWGVLPTHVIGSRVDEDCDVESVRRIMES